MKRIISFFCLIALIGTAVADQSTVLSPDGKTEYVANLGSFLGNIAGNVSVIDTATNNVTATITFPQLRQGFPEHPTWLGITPDGSKLCVFCRAQFADLFIIDTKTNNILTSIKDVSISPEDVIISPDGTRIYISDADRYSVTIIDTTTGTKNGIYTGTNSLPISLGETPDSSKLYIGCAQGLEVVDTETNAIFKWIPAGSGSRFTMQGNQLYSGGIVDTTTDTIVSPILNAPKFTTIMWSNPTDVIYGTALGSTQLNAEAKDPNTGAPVPGSFTYSEDLGPSLLWSACNVGTILSAGTHTLLITFTPTDSTDYKTTTATLTINVKQETPTITWNNPADIITGTALGSEQLNAVASVPGTYVYTPAAGNVLNSGTQTLHVDFRPTDTANYKTASKDVTINVNNVQKTTPTITWSNPADIAYGTKLSSTQLNAKASIPGTFVYTPAAGNILHVGAQTLKTIFTPKDATKYTTATKTVTINVATVPQANFSASPVSGKAPLPVTFTDISTGSPTTWTWKFGDGGSLTSKIPNIPAHTYTKKGKYSISLTVKNIVGSSTKTMPDYITVN